MVISLDASLDNRHLPAHNGPETVRLHPLKLEKSSCAAYLAWNHVFRGDHRGFIDLTPQTFLG
jgi:hypothetical protein